MGSTPGDCLHGPVTSELVDGRSSGVLAHITSLPGRYGIGDLGPNAREFVTRLAAAGQRYWQMLPVGPAGAGNSPYSSLSTFAGNPLLISPGLLLEAGLVDGGELAAIEVPDSSHVDYATVHRNKLALLSKAARRFGSRSDRAMSERFAEFREAQGPLWLEDFCLYRALQQIHDGESWTGWEEGLSRRQPAALARARVKLEESVEAHRVIQFLFFEQWHDLRRVAVDHGIELVGDLPLYVAHDSADVWTNPDLFLLDDEGQPEVVAGVPPDYFSKTGQRWGNPIFDWEEMAARNFAWWRTRVRHALALFDVLRIDHFRGIAGYWEIPAEEGTAVNGQWRPGPKEKLLGALRDDLGELPVVAEDLGKITDDVIALRDAFAVPGMRVAQFGFDKAPDATIHHPDTYPTSVWAYTGTHDNNTTNGWFWEGNPRHRVWRLKRPRRSLYRLVDGRIPWGLNEMVSRSRAMTAVFPVQDILELGAEARMNTPGVATGNWEWRLRESQLTDEALDQLHQLTRSTSRS
jgi:4-alpha-glucanotransferase